MKIQPGSKLLMIGDSITDVGRAQPVAEGLFDPLGRGYVNIVSALIGAVYPHYRIRVVNMGCSGNTVRSLDTAQSPQQLAQNIRTVRGQLTRTVEAIRAARAEMGGAAPQAQDAPEQAPAQTTPRRMRWNPATGQLE